MINRMYYTNKIKKLENAIICLKVFNVICFILILGVAGSLEVDKITMSQCIIRSIIILSIILFSIFITKIIKCFIKEYEKRMNKYYRY